MRNALIFIVSILVSLDAVAQTPYHVSDEVPVFVHSGPSNQYRIIARVNSGTSLIPLNRNQDTGYVQIRAENGTEGWIDGRFVNEGVSLKNRLPRLEAQLSESRAKVAEQAEELTELRARLEEVTAAGAESVAEAAQLENELARLQMEIDRMDESNLMGWLVRGGGIALAGVVLGLIIVNLPKRRRRTDEWF